MIITGTKEAYVDGRYEEVFAQFSVTHSSVSFLDTWQGKVAYTEKPVISWNVYRNQDNSGNWYTYWYACDWARQAYFPSSKGMECVEVSLKVWDQTPNDLYVNVRYIKRKVLRTAFLSLTLDTKGKAQWEKYLSSLSFAS